MGECRAGTSGSGTTVTVTKDATVTSAITASDNATIIVHENAVTGNPTQTEDGGTITSTTVDDVVAMIGNTAYSSLADAIAAVQGGETITMVADVASAAGMTVAEGKNFTVDFNNHTYTLNKPGAGSSGTETNGFQLLKGSTITFKNGTINISEENLATATSGYNVKRVIQNYADLTLDNMTIDGTNQYSKKDYVVSFNNGTSVIKDTKIKGADNSKVIFDVCTWATYVATSVTVSGSSVIDGNIEVSATNTPETLALTLTGGTHNGSLVMGTGADKATITKSDSFSEDAPEGYSWKSNGNGTSTLAEDVVVAQIGDTKYATLADAVAAAQDGDTITILQDFTLTTVSETILGASSTKYNVVISKSITIDGDNHVITASNDKRALGFDGANTQVTIKDLTIKANPTKAKDATLWICNNVNLTLDNVVVDGTSASYSATYNQPITIGSGISGRPTLNIINGSVVKTNNDATAHYDIIVWSPSDINVSNSTLKGYAAVYVKPQATGTIVNVSNSDVESHGYDGFSNAFGMFVTESNNNTFTLTSNNYSITAGDQYQVLTELKSTIGNVVKLLGTSTFTPNDAVHGTLVRDWNQYYVNSLYMDDANKETFANYISSECTVVKETSGDYNGLWKVTGPTPEVYYYWDTDNGQQGTYCHLADPFDNGWLCDGEYIDVLKDITLTKTIACKLTSGSFRFNLAENTVTKGNYSITLKTGVSVVTDKATDIFTAADGNAVIVETEENGSFTYSAVQSVAQIGDSYYKTLAEAVAAAQDGATITILSDFTIEGNEGVTIPAGKIITLDLNGKTIKNLVTSDSHSQLIVNKGTLTITDSSVGANGTMTNEVANGVSTGDWSAHNYATNIILNHGTLTVNAGNLIQVASTNISYAIDNRNNNASTTINGGKLTAGYIPIRSFYGTNLSVNIHGGTLSGMYDLYLQSSTILNIDGGTFSAPTRSAIYVEAASNITISGDAEFSNATDREFIAFDSDNVKDNSSLSVTGGTFNTDPSAYVADGYEAVQSGSVWTVQEFQGVAQIGDTKYATLAEAIAAANETTGATITLLSDVTESTTWTATKSMTLDLNGYTYTNTATANIPASYTGHSSYKASMMFAPAGSATFKVDATKGGKIVVNPAVKDAIGLCISDNINGSTAVYSDNNIQFVVKGENSSNSVFEFSDNAKYGILAYYRNSSSAIVADNAKIVSTRTTTGGVTVYLEAIGNVNMENVCIESSGPECICVGDSMKDEGDNNAKASFTNCSFSQTGTNGANWQKVAINVSSNALVNVNGGSYSGVGGSISVATSGGTVKLYSGTFHGTNNRFVTTGTSGYSWAKTAIYYKEACTFTGATTDETISGDIIAILSE